jgi:hypothetical protein
VGAARPLEITVAFSFAHYTGSQVPIPLERPPEDVTIASW